MIEDETQWAPLSIRKNFGPCAICLETKNAPIVGPAIDSILSVDSDILGREPIDLEPFYSREFRVLCVNAR